MCLDTVTKTVLLKKDKVIWKFVRVTKRVESSIIAHYDPWSSAKKVNLKSNRITTNPHKKDITVSESASYKSGFHCCITERDCKKMCNEYLGWGVRKNCKVLDYIIPKDTLVQYGADGEFKVIVTPVLINPRVK